MSEHVMEAELGAGRALSSFSKMAGLGEGIYASSTSADVGLQQTDQVGLTLPPKTTPEAKLSLDAYMITDRDFEDALKQLEPLLAEAEGRTSSFRVVTIHGSHRCYVAPPAKRRKLSGDLYEPLAQKLSSSPVIWPKSPTPNTALPVSVNLCTEKQHHDDGKESLCPNHSELSLSILNSSQEAIRLCQENVGNAHPSTYGEVGSIKETYLGSAASTRSRRSPTSSWGFSTAGSDSVVPEKDLDDQARVVKMGQESKISNDGAAHGVSACVASLCHRKVVRDPDVPLRSVEKECQGIDVDCPADMRSSRSCHFDGAAVQSVQISYNPDASQTIAGAIDLAANKTARKKDKSQDSLQPPQKSLQTSTLASIVRPFLQNLQQALSEGYSKTLSTHQIPVELRERFNTLLRKYQSDEQFQKAVATYTMELTGAVPPGGSDPGLLPLKLRQAFDTIYKKRRTDEGFRMSVDKFAIEFLAEKKSSEDISSAAIVLDNDKLNERMKQTNLDGLSTEQLIAYCRELESSRAEHVKTVKSVKEYAKRLMLKLEGKPRVGQHPEGPNPNPGNWTCFHPKTTRKDDKQGPCGRSNPHYEMKLLWKEVTHCRTCKGPYNEGFKLLKLQTPKKKYPKFRHSPDEAATRAEHQSPANGQANDTANAEAYNLCQLSIAQQAPSFEASSGQMHGHLGGSEQIHARHLSPGWHPIVDGRHHNPLSERSHSIPIGDPFSSVNDGTACDYPDFPNSDIGFTNSFHLNIDLNAQDREFDEFAIDSDPLFMDMDIDTGSSPQRTGSFPKETNILQEAFPQFEHSSEPFADHCPDRLNLFSQQIGSISERHALPPLHRPHLEVVNSNYGSGYVPVSSTNQQHVYSSNWALTQFDQLHKPYQSPYGPINPSTPMKSVHFGKGFPAGTISPIPHFDSMVPPNSTAAALPYMQPSLSASQPNHLMTKARPVIMITGADSEACVFDGQTETLSPLPWSSKRNYVKQPSSTRKVPKVQKIPNGRGRDWNKSPTPMTKRGPPKTPRLSRSKAAIAERAALREGVSTTPALTESQISRVRTQNKTSAVFLGRTTKSWEEPVESYSAKIIIEIPDDDVEVQEEAWEGMQQEEEDMEDESELEVEFDDDELTAAFNAEFDRQDRAAALEAADEESEVSEEE